MNWIHGPSNVSPSVALPRMPLVAPGLISSPGMETEIGQKLLSRGLSRNRLWAEGWLYEPTITDVKRSHPDISWAVLDFTLPLSTSFPMPTLKLFKRSSSKISASESGPVTDGPVNNKEDIPRPIEVTSDNAVPVYSDGLKKAWTAAHRELPQAKGVEKVLNKIECVQATLTLSPGQQTAIDTLVAPAKALMDSSQISEAIHKGLNAFMETVPPLMKALDEVAKLHPFIGVAVLAFKGVYMLEKKKTENDKRILALNSEMKDMMEVLLTLRGISSPTVIGPDGKTITDRMEKLCEDVAEDIEKCASACDTYLTRKFYIKLLAGPLIWEGRLIEFVNVFTNRKKQFEFAMAIHTTVGVGVAIRKMDVVDERTAELSQRMDVMLQLFQEFITPQQKALAAKVEEMGRDAALENEGMMKELVDAEPSSGPQSRPGGGRPLDLDELRKEIKRDPEEVIDMNFEFFNRKFSIQTREIEENMARVFGREGDRIISTLTAGPHDRIADQDIYDLWKYMGWRGSVESRQFVLALKDHFVEKASVNSDSVTGPDSWALKYINIGRMRNILDAFDDDVSGFVTVNEVNSFTRSRPLGWSLPHWIAYWAIGWQMTCTEYCAKIEGIFNAMIRLSGEVLPENRQAVYNYIDQTWRTITVYVQSIEREEGTEELRQKFDFHVAAEESRLRRNFDDISYRLDSPDTVRLVSGDGRLETTLFPMFYLILKRDLQKLSLAQKHVLAQDELFESRRAITWISFVIADRFTHLEGIFKEHNLEAQSQFGIFAKGLYKNFLEADTFLESDEFRRRLYTVSYRDEIIPDLDSTPLSVLYYPTAERYKINLAAYDPQEPLPPPVEGAHPLLGVYYGMKYDGSRVRKPMTKYTFSKGEGEGTFVFVWEDYEYGRYWERKTTGTWSPPSEDGRIPLEMKVGDEVVARATFDPEENSIRGTAEYEGEFVFKRDPDFVRFYPAPCTLNARTRWEFAMVSVLDRVRQQAWSLKRILKKMKDGKRFMESIQRNYTLEVEKHEELSSLFSGLYEADAQFYRSLVRLRLVEITLFENDYCPNCSTIPAGSKVVCLVCRTGIGGRSLGLCSKPSCVNSTFDFWGGETQKTHPPTHGMIKVLGHIACRDMIQVEERAKIIFEYVREQISQPDDDGRIPEQCVCCKTPVSPPCWACVDCIEYPYICDNCGHSNLASDERHAKTHTIMRIFSKVEKREARMEERLMLLEDRLAGVERTLTGQTQTLAEIRQTLGLLVEKRTGGSQGQSLADSGLPATLIEFGSGQLEEEAGAMEAA